MAGTGTAHLRPAGEALLRVEDLTVEFRTRAGVVQAVSGISLDVLPGETVGLVGESGCGKSTTGKAIMNLPSPTSGTVTMDGTELTGLSRRQARGLRRRMQMVFQDPISSLNPRRRIRDTIAEPLHIARDLDNKADRVSAIMEAVGLDPANGHRRPHEFSGGQCQRISIARSLILQPELLICDEPVSALDVSVQAQILNLLEDLKAEYGLSYLFVAHDLAVVKNISDRVVVMYLGKICEVAPSEELFARPRHPYTAMLLAAIPRPDTEVRPTAALTGDLPSPLNPPSGCRFRTRCPLAQEICATSEPQIRPVGDDHFVACHFAESLAELPLAEPALVAGAA